MFVIAKTFLANGPRHIQTKTGTKMVSAFGFADIEGESGLPVGVVAFGSLAVELAKYAKGSSIRVSGIFKANDYTKRNGEEVHGYQITAEGIAGVKAARGKYRDSKPKPENRQLANQATADFYDDAIPQHF